MTLLVEPTGLAALSGHQVLTPNGRWVSLALRPDTIEPSLAYGVLTEDEYHLRGRGPFSGWMLDIGGYVGFVGIALAVENPDLRVVTVEPLAENVAMCEENVRLNGLADRVHVLHAAAGKDEPTEIVYGYEHVEGEPDGYVQNSRFVGNIYAKGSHPMTATSCVVDGVSVASILDRYEIDRVSLMKIDCEGCEWTLFTQGGMGRVDTIFGEWHGDPRLPGLQKLLPDHDVVQVDDNPVNGIFWATRK